MVSKAVLFASSEREFIKAEIKWLKAGGKYISPNGEDITGKKLEELEARLESANEAMDEDGQNSNQS